MGNSSFVYVVFILVYLGMIFGRLPRLALDRTGVLYVGGNFNNVGGVADADYIFAWTGTAVEALGVPPDGEVEKIVIAPDGKVFVGGAFATIGSLTSVDRIAIWNGSVWSPPDVNVTGVITVYGADFGNADPSVQGNYDIYIGFNGSGASYFAGATTVTNAGTVPVYPQIVVTRSGGTSARIVSVRNATTGKELSFDYALLSGETLTVDTHPDRQTCESSFYGPRPDAILAGSDLSDFMLLPGANTITAFVDTAGSPTITAYMLWSDAYDGIDD